MNRIHNLIAKISAPTTSLVSGAILIALFQIPAMPVTRTNAEQTRINADKSDQKSEIVQSVTVGESPIAEIFFGKETKEREKEQMVDKQIELVSTRKAYPASYEVVKKHEKTISRKAHEKNVPLDVAIGVAFLENGGSEYAVSSAGALGVFQLMPGTARSLGLTVNKKMDERKNPEKNIEAGVTYLANNYARFGDWGLATWAYHAGEGNVSKAVKIYAKANHGKNLAGVKDPSAMREYVEKYGITVHKLLSDVNVKAFTKKLNDDSAGYPYKVIATATLYRKSGLPVSVGPKIKSKANKAL